MRTLTVLFDGRCSVCVASARFLLRADQAVPIVTLDAHSPAARERFPALRSYLGRELVVVADDGAAWVGPAAFLVCFWALRRWRLLVRVLSGDLLLPWTLAGLRAVGANRGRLGFVAGFGACDDHCGVVAGGAGPYR